MNTTLIVIDVQRDYFKGGKNELVNAEEALIHIKRILSLFRDKNLPIFYIQHINLQENAAFFLPGSDGIKIHEYIAPQPGEKVVVKHTPDSFFQTELQKNLKSKNIKRLVVCGMMSHMCVDTTVRTAKSSGYEVVLLSEGCATKDLEWDGTVIPAKTVHKAFMASLQTTFARVLDTKTFLDEMRNILQ